MNGKGIEVVRLRMHFAMEALMDKKHRIIQIRCAIRDGEIGKNGVHAVRFRDKSAMEALMEKAPEK